MANVNEHTKGVGERLGSGTELTFSINRADPTPLHEQVAAEIRRAIAEGEAGPGDRIPQARDLATVLGVNNNTVLRALARCACSVTKGCSRSDAAARSASPAVPIAVL